MKTISIQSAALSLQSTVNSCRSKQFDFAHCDAPEAAKS